MHDIHSETAATDASDIHALTLMLVSLHLPSMQVVHLAAERWQFCNALWTPGAGQVVDRTGLQIRARCSSTHPAETASACARERIFQIVLTIRCFKNNVGTYEIFAPHLTLL